MSPPSRDMRSPLRALLAFAHLAASLALLANTGCTTETGTRAAVALPPRPLPDGTVPGDLELMPTALLKSIPLNAYVRVQAAPGRPGVPYFGGMRQSWRSDDVATLKYNDHFRKASSAFLKQIFPNSTEDARSPAGNAAQLRVEVNLSNTSYHREAQELFRSDGLHHGFDLHHDLVDRDRLDANLHLAGFDLGEIEDVVHE